MTMSKSDPSDRSPLGSRIGGPPGYVAMGEAAAAEPFVGITTDGHVRQGLFTLESTGVSTASVRAAAEAFLSTLSTAQREQASFPIETVEWRKWSNIHRTLMRHGMSYALMTEGQRESANALLQASLSLQGYQAARDVMRLNETIREMTGRDEEYGEFLYWLSIMGTPSPTGPWGWQIDGHHLIINFFVLGDQVVMSPVFMGSEPVYAAGGKYAGTRVFKEEEELGLSLMQSLTADQRRKAAVGSDLPSDVLATAFKDNLVLPLDGLEYGDLSAPERNRLMRIIELNVGRLRQGHAEVRLAEVKRHLDETRFAWIGRVEDDSVFYYRIYNPVLLLEFDHQGGIAFSGVPPSRNHIHVLMRTPNGNDYGKDLLRLHYLRSPHHQPEGRPTL